MVKRFICCLIYTSYCYKIDGFDAEGNFIFADTDKKGVVNANDKVILGSPIPDLTYGLNINMEYNDVDLTVCFQDVYKRQNKNRPLIVNLRGPASHVLGTSCNVSDYKDESMIFLLYTAIKPIQPP